MFESIVTCFYLLAAVTIDLEFNQTQINFILRAKLTGANGSLLFSNQVKEVLHNQGMLNSFV